MKYYYIDNGTQVGPFEVNELFNKGIRPETLVWSSDLTNWTPAWKVDELKPVIDSSLATREPPQIDTEKAEVTPPPYSSNTQESRRSGCGTRTLVVTLILVIIGAVLVLTCPDRKSHSDAIRQEFNAAMSQKMGTSNGVLETIIQMGSKYVMGVAADNALDQLLTVDNYFVVSVGRIHYDGSDHVASIGVLNHIFTVNRDDIVQALDQAEQAARRMQSDETSDSDIIGSTIDLLKQIFN